MNTNTAQVDDLQLIALPTAVKCTELFVQFALTEWSLRPLLDEAVNAACQLVSAIVDSADPKAPGLITVRLSLRDEYLVIEIEDDQLVPPTFAAPTLAGRRTGVVPKEGRGKLVWCELPLPSGLAASSVPLPRRERRKSPAAEQLANEPAEVDPQLVQRILFGLNGSPDRHAE